MLFTNPKKLIEAAAEETQDPNSELLDVEVSPKVSDTIEYLDDALSSVEDDDCKDGKCDDEDKSVVCAHPEDVSCGTAVANESAIPVLEANNAYGSVKYLVRLEDVMLLKEAEGEEAEADEDEGHEDEHEGEESHEEAEEDEDEESSEPDAGEVVEKIADANEIDKDSVGIVINTKEVKIAAECALYEAKCGKKNGKAGRKLVKIGEAVEQLINAGYKIIKA